jgi:Uma2 family endonuclease
MATQTLISVEQYLRTTSDPDCEYVRGTLEDRAVPERNHAAWQKVLLRWFADHEHAWQIEVFTELRVQVASDEFRIPDVTILSRTAPREQIITHPPLAVFEILSPTDTMSSMLEKLESYQQMGIPAIWVIDPAVTDQSRAASWLYSSGHLTPSTVFELPGAGFRVSIAEIAALLD